MRYFQQFFLFLIVINTISCSNNTEASKLDLEASLLHAIAHFNTAFEQGNLEVLDTMVTKNYRHTNGNSKAIGKEDWFMYLRKRTSAIQSGDLEIISYDMSDVDIEISENIAIVTGRVNVSSTTNEGIKHGSFRVTHIWIYQDKQWKRTGFHDGKIE